MVTYVTWLLPNSIDLLMFKALLWWLHHFFCLSCVNCLIHSHSLSFLTVQHSSFFIFSIGSSLSYPFFLYLVHVLFIVAISLHHIIIMCFYSTWWLPVFCDTVIVCIILHVLAFICYYVIIVGKYYLYFKPGFFPPNFANYYCSFCTNIYMQPILFLYSLPTCLWWQHVVRMWFLSERVAWCASSLTQLIC